MNKRFNFTILITSLLCFVPMIVGLILWNKLPEKLPTNYSLNSEVGNVAPKWINIILLPIIFATLNIVVNMRISPKTEENVGKRLASFVVWLVPILAVVVGTFMIIKPLGLPLEAMSLVAYFMSLVFIIVGNYIPKSKPNNVVGFRLPWIMNDDDLWKKTHRFSGLVLVICGFASFITSFFVIGKYVFLVSLGIIIFVPLIYSLIIKNNK